MEDGTSSKLCVEEDAAVGTGAEKPGLARMEHAIHDAEASGRLLVPLENLRKKGLQAL
jgi:hypothetical protein